MSPLAAALSISPASPSQHECPDVGRTRLERVGAPLGLAYVISGGAGADLVHARPRIVEKEPDHLAREPVTTPLAEARQRCRIQVCRIGHRREVRVAIPGPGARTDEIAQSLACARLRRYASLLSASRMDRTPAPAPSACPYTADPATTTVAPAARMFPTLPESTPPSTSSSAALPISSRSARAF